MEYCKVHPPERIDISISNTLFCTLCLQKLTDYEVYRTDEDRTP